MTLSRWFRDYVYIPLGGNRLGPEVTYRNLFVVFFLCGLWHGSGLHLRRVGPVSRLLRLAAERMYVTHVGPLRGGLVAWARTFLIVVIGWVFFRANSLDQAVGMLQVMAGLVSPTVVFYDLRRPPCRTTCSSPCAASPSRCCRSRSFPCGWTAHHASPPWKAAAAVVLFCYSVALLSVNSFNPFIYFRF